MSDLNPLLLSDIDGLALHTRGKVRDIYCVGDRLLIVATDRISAFDVILPSGIPHKGAVLTQLSAYWFRRTSHIIPNHFVSTSFEDIAAVAPSSESRLRGRSMIVRRAERIDVECVVRGYLSGSAWSEYRRFGTLAGEPLPEGLVESDRLEEPLFSPSTKAQAGHDQNIDFPTLANMVGGDLARQLRDASIAVYLHAERQARERGIIIADTKMEFGFCEGQLTLIDELLTPDSSRFWPADRYQAGRPQPSFDKQFVRDWLEQTHWDKEPPAPDLPKEIVLRTAEKYMEAYERITGDPFTEE